MLNKQEYIHRFLIRYDNPLIILSSISFFIFFLTIKIKSETINWLSISSLAVYLIHDNGYINGYLMNIIHKMFISIDNVLVLSIVLLITALIIFLSCILIDKVRLIIMNPIENLIYKLKINSIYHQMIDYLNRVIP